MNLVLINLLLLLIGLFVAAGVAGLPAIVQWPRPAYALARQTRWPWARTVAVW